MMRSGAGGAELDLLMAHAGGDVAQAVACSHPRAQVFWAHIQALGPD